MMEPTIHKWMPACPTMKWIVPPLRGAEAVMAEIHQIRCIEESAELRALQYEARDSIRPEESSRAPPVPRNDGSRLNTQQWSEDLMNELNIQVSRDKLRRKHAKILTRNTVFQ